MGPERGLSCLILVLSLVLVSCSAAAANTFKQPALFLTIKSSNFGMAKIDHIKCGYLVVTDILISPDGVPLPFCNDHCVYNKRAGLKIIASFGGSVVPSDLFVFLSCDDKRRAAFVDNLIEFTVSHGFDGIDLSWLYPALQERDRYVRLLKDLRQACDRYGLLLTVTVPSRPSVIEVNYPVEKIDKYADFVILSTTEFRKLRKTSFIAPLYSSSPGSSNSIDYHVDRWKLAGLSCGKIVIVIQTMTLTYKLYIQNEYRVGTPALQLKIRPYYKICRKLYSGSLEIWDSSAKSPYAFRDLSWYSYENEKSIKEKVGFVIQQNLAGLAVFYYDEDDPINICGDGQYPLTTIVMAAMQSDYLPPSVITDSQIYHFDSALNSSPFSQMRQDIYNSAVNNKQPCDVYVEESSDAIEQLAPPLHPPKSCLHQLPSLRIFATAHGPTTTTTTTTTTPKPMEFLTMAPATYRPPTFCQACNPCVKLVATSGSHEPKVPTTPPAPVNTPSSCLSAQLYSEMNVSAPVSVQFQANSVGAQPIPSFGVFETKVCPCDGILQDPHDKRSYYLCKRGLPMCEENKFTCAHGYIFDERCKKCVVEGS
ncbi:chitinase-3-like protein 1 [Anopheles ziemanni]|uniref:chitinase-3-like protein 1 n=1 Tax=Anopheles coustani TaxID=139045 RepID=UPI002659B859|nr:chitinase-3-like protein 1 [Anopheles coustani]XP_058176932.1 chitinase-3-like protein 1 [Anopheles ziemanni]